MKKSIKANIMYQMVYEIFALCLPLITTPYVTRVLGAENLGIYSYTYSIATYFGLFAMLGVKTHGNREIAKQSDPEKLRSTFWSIYAVQFVVSSVMMAAYLVLTVFFVRENRACYAAQAIYVLSCLLDISWLFFGMEQFKTTTIRSVIVKLFTTVLVLTLIRKRTDVFLYCLVMASGYLLSQLILWAQLPKALRRIEIEPRRMVQNIRPMLRLFIPVVAISLYNVLDKIMLGGCSSKTQLGYYEATEKIILCVKSVITAFGTVMMPRMVRLVADGKRKERDRYMALSTEVIMGIVFALTLGIVAVADVFAPVFWGAEFSECAMLLVTLSMTLPCGACANIVRTQYLLPNGMDTAVIASVIGGAVCNILANLALIPAYGAQGAALGTVVAETVVFIIQFIYARRRGDFSLYFEKMIPYALFGLLMLGVVRLVRISAEQTVTWLLLEIAVGGAVYCALALGYMIYTRNELLLNIIRKIKR